MKNITDFLLNTFLQVYFFMYGRQVIQDLNMLQHIKKSSGNAARICLYPRHNNKISLILKCTLYRMQHMLLFLQAPRNKSDKSIVPCHEHKLSQPPI